MTQILINDFEINIQNSRRNFIMPRPTGTLCPGTLAIPGRSRSCPNLWLSSLEWGDDVEKPIYKRACCCCYLLKMDGFLERGQIGVAKKQRRREC